MPTGVPELFIAAPGEAAKAHSRSQIAREAVSKLRYETVRKVMDALGVELTVATPT